jgi:hypothetical protein
MNRNLWLLALLQGHLLTNNVAFTPSMGWSGRPLAPIGWLVTLPAPPESVGDASTELDP